MIMTILYYIMEKEWNILYKIFNNFVTYHINKPKIKHTTTLYTNVKIYSW